MLCLIRLQVQVQPLVVSEQLNRESIGIELDEFNVNLIQNRLSEQRTMKAIWNEHSRQAA